MSYFHFHGDDVQFDHKLESIRCEAIKPNGEQCRNRTVIGQVFCSIHTKNKLKLQIKNSTIAMGGKGLFAYGRDRDIIFKPNKRICLYNGELIDEDELIERYADYTAPYGIQLNKGMYEDAAIERGIGAMANHSRSQRKINAKLSVTRGNRAQLMSIKNIKGGQEIFVDYGSDYDFDEDVETSTNRKKYTV